MGRRRRRSLLKQRSQSTGSLAAPAPVAAPETGEDAAGDDVSPAEDGAVEADAGGEPDGGSPPEAEAMEPVEAPEDAASDAPSPPDAPEAEDGPEIESPVDVEEASPEGDGDASEDAPKVRFVAYREMLLGWRPNPPKRRPRACVTFADLQLAASIAAMAVVMLIAGVVGLAILAWSSVGG